MTSGSKQLILDVVSFAGFSFSQGVRFDITCDQALPTGHSVDPVQDITVVHRDGDTMVTFGEPPALLTDPNATVADYEAAEPAFDSPNSLRYRIYRHTEPIDATTIRSAELVDEIAPLSNWNPYYYGVYWRNDDASIVPRLPVDDGILSQPDQAIYVHRSSEQADAYYAVSYVIDGEEDLTNWVVGENVSTAPVPEAPGTGMVLLRQHVHYGDGPNDYWQYVGANMEGPDLYYYNRWDAPPYYNMPSSAFDYLVAVPPEQYQVDPSPVDVALHCWGANLNGGYGWWYEAENGALLVSTNMQPYDWWTASHDNGGTIRPFTDVDGNGGGRVSDYPADRILSFLDGFVKENWSVDDDRVLVTGNSMGGAGAIMWGARAADQFAYANGWVGVYIPRETPQFIESFEGVYGRDAWNCEYEDTGMPAFDYWDSARFILEDPGREVPYLCFANGKNDSAIGWNQAWTFVSALIEARQPFNFVWGQAGHGQRSSLPGGNDRYIGVTIERNATLPAFTNCSLDGDMGDGDPAVGDLSGSINAYLLWQPSDAVDMAHRWEMTVQLISSSPEDACTVDITPRRCQSFDQEPGTVVIWTNTDIATGTRIASGSVTVDEWGLVTLPATTVSKGTNRIVAVVPLPGDADLNDVVDGLDYVVWSTNYHQSGGWADGDFTGDGIVDGLDYIVWSMNYEAVVPGGGIASLQLVAASAAEQLPESEPVGEAGGGAIRRSFTLPASVAQLRPGVSAGLGGWASHAAGAQSEADMAGGDEDGRDVPAWPVNRLRAIAPAGVPDEVAQVLLTDTGTAGMRSPSHGLAALEDDLVDILGLVQLRAPLHA